MDHDNDYDRRGKQNGRTPQYFWLQTSSQVGYIDQCGQRLSSQLKKVGNPMEKMLGWLPLQLLKILLRRFLSISLFPVNNVVTLALLLHDFGYKDESPMLAFNVETIKNRINNEYDATALQFTILQYYR
jgi:hypothetical protein